MVKAETILALCERLKFHSRQADQEGQEDLAFDCRLALLYCQRLAALTIADEAAAAFDPVRRRELTEEAAALWQEARP
jgi:hypothetical protein